MSGGGMSAVTLPGGQKMPMIGYGTFTVGQSTQEEVYEAVKSALEAGYRHMDCAYTYDNEEAVGRALKEVFDSGSLSRENVFITTKLWNTYHGTDRAKEGLQKSLKWLGLDYVDLFLVHWPYAFSVSEVNYPKDENGKVMFDTTTTIEDTWRGMEICHDSGLTKNIGISNFNKAQTDRVLKIARVKPCNMQAELNVYHSNPALVNYCQSNGITVTAFAPLGAPNRPWRKEDEPKLIDDPILIEIGQRKKKTSAQVALRYLIQLGITAIPKSLSPNRMKENLQILDFELTEAEMTTLKHLNKNIRYYLDPIAQDHPEWPFHVQY